MCRIRGRCRWPSSPPAPQHFRLFRELRSRNPTDHGRVAIRRPIAAPIIEPAIPIPPPPVRPDNVVIVSGFPRSGTSMLMQMLDAAGLPALTDGVRTTDNPRGYLEFEAVKQVHKDNKWFDSAKVRQ